MKKTESLNSYPAIFAVLMKKSKQPLPLKHVLSSIFLLLTLAWLTVCLPYVNDAKEKAKQQTVQSDKRPDTGNTNPLSNTNEEKSESSVSLLSEYLHETLSLTQHFVLLSSSFRHHPSDLYLAYHPDLVIPPPEA